MDHGSSPFSPASTADSFGKFPSPATHKVQPLVNGVSRPSTSASLPSTSASGSLMSAVNRAADGIPKVERVLQPSTEKHLKSSPRPMGARHVDIFSMSSPTAAQSKPDYNEDVAERNLDMARVALEGNQYEYVPSKYQEDVATRNAFPPLPGKDSPDTSLSSARGNINGFDQSRELGSRMSDHRPMHLKSPDAPYAKHQQLPTLNGAHSRPPSQRSWNPQSPLHEPRSIYGLGVEGVASTPLIASRKSQMDSIHDGTLAMRSPDTASTYRAKSDALRNYQLSPSEILQARSVDYSLPSRPSTAMSANGSTSRGRSDYGMRSPPSMGNLSSVKRSINLPHRKIMDLTGNDSEVFAETSPEFNYSSSPIVEEARVDVMRKVPGPTIEKRTSHPTLARPGPAPMIPVEQLPVFAAQVAPSLQSRRPASQPIVSPSPKAKSRTSTFSPISTVASVQPRSSVYIENPPRFDVVEAVERSSGLAEDTTLGDQSDQLREDGRPLRQNGNHTTTIPLQNKTEDAQTTADKQRGLIPGMPTINGSGSMANGAHHVDTGTLVNGTSQPVAENSPSIAAAAAAQPSIHGPGGNLPSIDLVDSSRVFGVSTRDFAATSTKAALRSVPEDAEVNGDGKAKRPGRLVTERRSASHDPNSGRITIQDPGPRRPPLFRYRSTFDEVEFAQKQADARAALIRLQQSLNENFLSQSPAVRPSKTGTSKHMFSLSDGRPFAPSTIFAQARTNSPVSAEVKVETDTSTEDIKGETNYHLLTTVSDSDKDRHGESQSRADQHPNSEYEREQNFESELGGPGPSIDNEEDDTKRPIPHPTYLHFSGLRLQQPLESIPPSPGEISLSSFPIPASSPRQSVRPGSDSEGTKAGHKKHASHHSQQSSSAGSRTMRRPSSQRSQASSASVFSIPYHMIPDRSSSIRERSVVEEAG